MNSMLEAALSYSQRGWKVTPINYILPDGDCSCGKGKYPEHRSAGKHPVNIAWTKDLLSDIEIRQLWSENPNYNIGIVTGTRSGLFVLDIDPENGGYEALNELIRENGDLSSGFRVRTGSGGQHFYFPLPDFVPTNSAGRLPKGIDVRGEGGQVVAAPSRSGKGLYEVIVDESISPAPQWLLDLIRPVERPVVRAGSLDSLGSMTPYLRGGIERELARLDEMARLKTPDGRGYAGPPWDATCYEIACNLLELCNEAGGGHDTAHYHFVARAPRDAGFTPERIEDKWASAERKIGTKARGLGGTSALGFGPAIVTSNVTSLASVTPIRPPSGQLPPADASKAASQGDEMDEWSPDALAGGQPAGPTPDEMVDSFIAELLTSEQLDDIPPLKPIIDGWLYLDSIARLNGPSGSGKSFVALDMAMSIATGRPWHGCETAAGSVVYIVAEGGSGARQRVRAWEREYHANQRVGAAIRFLTRPVQVGDDLDWWKTIEACRRLKPSFVVLDTQARVTVGVNENDAKEMGVIIDRLEALRRATEACVLLIHHEGKVAPGGRGSSAVKGAMHTELAVSSEEGRIFIRSEKQKDSVELPPVELKRKIVQLGEDAEGRPMTSLVLVEPGWEHEDLAGLVSPEASWLEQIENVAYNSFCFGIGGTKAEYLTVLNEALKENHKKPIPKRSWQRAWGQALESKIVVRITGQTTYRWCPPSRRPGATMAVGKVGKEDGGYYAPGDLSGEEGEAPSGIEAARKRLADQKRADRASGIDMNEEVE